MRTHRNFGDARQVTGCAHCGGRTSSRDHIPSKVLLDRPYPRDLPVVWACQTCNQSLSIDEAYLACLVECARTGATSIDEVERPAVSRILARTPALMAKINSSWFSDGSIATVGVETLRVRNVILKLARGHVLYDLNEPRVDEPQRSTFVPLSSTGNEERIRFEEPPFWQVWPEVGSRAMQVVAESSTRRPQWLVLQPGRYRYLASVDESVAVRMVLSEYLACEVVWT